MKIWQLLLIYVIGVVVLLYFMTILPGKRKNKKTRAMHDSIVPGDQISTIGGIIATVDARDGDTLTLLIDPNTKTTMRIVVYAVQNILEKGSGALPAAEDKTE